MESLGIRKSSSNILVAISLVVIYMIFQIFVFGVNQQSMSETMKLALRMSVTKKLFYAINYFLYQNFTVVSMLIYFIIYNHLKNVIELIKKVEGEEDAQIFLRTIKESSISVDMICDALDSTKVIYALNTVIYIFHFGMFSVVSLYSFISILSRSINENEKFFTIMAVSWNIYYSPFIMWTFIYSNRIKKLGKQFLVQIQKCSMSYKINEKVQNQISTIFYQLSHRRPIVSCGIYIIDWALLFSFVSSIFSYLIIIVQFEFTLLQN